MNTLKPWIELTKPRIIFMQLVTVGLGFVAARASTPVSWWMMLALMVGTLFSAAGAAVLNHFLERNIDRLMVRTQNRPIVSGKIEASSAATFGFITLAVGLVVLWVGTNPMTMFLSFLTAFMYALVYTPLKQISWVNTFIGAIPGAIPPLAGWAAATGQVGHHAWLLFGLMFFWQLPHFFAIAWTCKDDYKAAGFKMLSVEDETGDRTVFQMTIHTIILMVMSLLMVNYQMGHSFFLATSVACGMWQLTAVYGFYKKRDRATALKVMKISIYYLPLVFIAMLLERLWT